MTDLTSLTLAEARSGLASKSFTSLELTDAHLQAIEAARVLNAFVMETADQARPMAREADARIVKGEGGRRAGANTTLVPGGSSGGSASAVAALLGMGATATDTGGSIRQPAAFTATVGMKPTYGRCSRWGIVAFASSLDQAGPIGRTVRDAAILLGSMATADPKDTTSTDAAVPDYEAAIGRSVKGLRIGIP